MAGHVFGAITWRGLCAGALVTSLVVGACSSKQADGPASASGAAKPGSAAPPADEPPAPAAKPPSTQDEILGWIKRPAKAYAGSLEDKPFTITLVDGFVAPKPPTGMVPEFRLATSTASTYTVSDRLIVELGQTMGLSVDSDMKETKRAKLPDGRDAVWFEHTKSIVGDFRQGLVVDVSQDKGPHCRASLLGEDVGPIALANKDALYPFLQQLCASFALK
jgi:hypothetical protein